MGRLKQIYRLVAAILYELQPFLISDVIIFTKTTLKESSYVAITSWQASNWFFENLLVMIYRFMFKLSYKIWIFISIYTFIGIYLIYYGSHELLKFYFIVTAFFAMFCSMSNRNRLPNEWTGYSVLNPNYQAIQGTMDAAQIDRELRRF